MAPAGATFLAGLNGERQFDDRTEREDRRRSVGHRLAVLNDCTLAPHLDFICVRCVSPSVILLAGLINIWEGLTVSSSPVMPGVSLTY